MADTSNLKLCADLRTVAEQLDRPDGWGRAALSVRGAIEAIERLERERDEYARCLDGGVDCAQEKLRLRAALEQIRVFALQETYGSSAGYKGIADRLAGDLFKVTTIAREALRGAVPAEEAKTAIGSGPCQHPFRTHWTGGGDKTGVTCATCGAELAEDKTS